MPPPVAPPRPPDDGAAGLPREPAGATLACEHPCENHPAHEARTPPLGDQRRPAPRRAAPDPGAHPGRSRRGRRKLRAFIGGGMELLDPFGLEGMADAVITLGVAVTEGRRIAVYGDYDADGVTACAMLTRALRAGRRRRAPLHSQPDDRGLRAPHRRPRGAGRARGAVRGDRRLRDELGRGRGQPASRDGAGGDGPPPPARPRREPPPPGARGRADQPQAAGRHLWLRRSGRRRGGLEAALRPRGRGDRPRRSGRGHDRPRRPGHDRRHDAAPGREPDHRPPGAGDGCWSWPGCEPSPRPPTSPPPSPPPTSPSASPPGSTRPAGWRTPSSPSTSASATPRRSAPRWLAVSTSRTGAARPRSPPPWSRPRSGSPRSRRAPRPSSSATRAGRWASSDWSPAS